jgi:transposase
MPSSTVLDIPPEEQAQMVTALRRARYGYLLALHLLLLCAAGRRPTEIAAVLFCSRSSVYRTAWAYREKTLGLEHDDAGRLAPPMRTTVLCPTLRRTLVGRLKATPQVYGWCRTRWSGATLALTLQTTRGIAVSAETMRRWLHEIGWVWRRPQLVAKEDDPHRVARSARSRSAFEPLKRSEAMVFADALDIHLLPKVGCAWRPKGTQLAVMTPGQHQKHSLAGALELTTGTLRHGLGARQTNAWFRDVLDLLEASSPAERDTRLDVVVDHDKLHQAKAVEQWLAAPPRVTRLLLPTSGPRANPIERAFGDGHDCCARTHQRTRVQALVADVESHLQVNGPWLYQLSAIDYEPAVTAAVEKIAATEQAEVAA